MIIILFPEGIFIFMASIFISLRLPPMAVPRALGHMEEWDSCQGSFESECVTSGASLFLLTKEFSQQRNQELSSWFPNLQRSQCTLPIAHCVQCAGGPGVVPHSRLFLTRFHFHQVSVSSLRYVQQVSYSWQTPGNDTNFNSTLECNFVGNILHNRWRWGEAARESHPWGTAHHTTWPGMTTALRSVVIAPKPVMSWIKSLFKGDIFPSYFYSGGVDHLEIIKD